jgi:hypothetical protein
MFNINKILRGGLDGTNNDILSNKEEKNDSIVRDPIEEEKNDSRVPTEEKKENDNNNLNTNNNDTFKNVMNTIYKTLDIDQRYIEKIDLFVNKYNDVEKYKLINSVNDNLPKLLEADRKIKKLLDENKLSENNVNLFKDTIYELGKLQGLILIKKASESCDQLTTVLLEAFKNKLSVVNDILIDNLDIKENNKTENESVKEMSGGSTDSVPIFGDVMKTIYKALDLSATDEATINSKLQNYTNVEKYKLINSANKYLENLVDADKKIIKLEMEDKLSKDNIVLFKTTLAELAKLQGLILIRKASENCDELIKVLLEAFKNKLSVVNDILINNLNDQKGGDNIFKHKFFKYKTKYLNLLKNKV